MKTLKQTLKKLSKEKYFSINTPTAVVGVRGTTFMVTAEQSEKYKPVAIKIAVLSGKVELGNAENPEEKVLVEELTQGHLPGPDFAKLRGHSKQPHFFKFFRNLLCVIMT